MTDPVIVTRAAKGNALTWEEGDANFTNLKNAINDANTAISSIATQSKTLQWVGNITTTLGSNRWYPNKNITLTGAYLSINTTSTASITATINKNGTSIGTVILPANTNKSTTTSLSTAMTTSDYILVDIAGTSGANASLTITYI